MTIKIDRFLINFDLGFGSFSPLLNSIFGIRIDGLVVNNASDGFLVSKLLSLP